MIRLCTLALLAAAPAQAEVIDRPCQLTHFCPMVAPCVPQEAAVTIRTDTDRQTVTFGLNGSEGEMVLIRHDDRIIVASYIDSKGDKPRNTLLTVFAEGTFAYTTHMVNEKNVGLGFSAYGQCQDMN